jgi:hypothetical protein
MKNENKKDDPTSGFLEKPDGNAPSGPVMKTPRAWALETGNGPPGARNRWADHSKGMSSPRGSMAHEVASVLHGWSQHAHHENGAMSMTKEDYLKALEAAMPKEGNPKPHMPACSKHSAFYKKEAEA